jgi:hypothetical protein
MTFLSVPLFDHHAYVPCFSKDVQIPTFDKGRTSDVTSQQRMHLLHATWSYLWCNQPWVRVSLVFYCGLFRLTDLETLILIADCSVYPIWTFWYWLQIVPILIASHIFWNRARSGCNQSAEDSYSSMAPDPTFAFFGVPCCPTLDFVFIFWIMIRFSTLLTSLFCIQSLEHLDNSLVKLWKRVKGQYRNIMV